jgi:hypothetical protein
MAKKSKEMSVLEILDAAAKLVKANKHYPTREELREIGISRDMARSKFGNYQSLNKALYPRVQDYILDLVEESAGIKLPKAGTYVITSAVTGASAHEGFLKNLRTYCNKNKAVLVVVPTIGRECQLVIDPAFRGAHIAIDDTQINNNCSILGIKSSALASDPMSGLNRVGQRNGTFIAGSTKQRLKFVATAKNRMPHALMSTGAATLPKYIEGQLPRKNYYIANHDHVIGALVVEVVDKEIYHFRQIVADKNGSFVDLGEYYTNGKLAKMRPSHIILGDWHSGKTDPEVRKATEQLSDALGIKTWVVHDFFDGDSISHHDKGKQALLAMKAMAGRLDLQAEMDGYVKDLEEISKKRDVVIVKSNHDEHLERYLSEARYIKHPRNHKLGLVLANAYIEGHNPLEYYTKIVKKAKVKNVTWLKRDEDFVVAGIQLGAHGDRGANGSRASIAQMENSYGLVTYGHSHTPEILRGAWCVGTSTSRKPDYGDGPSSWMNTHCLVYPNGTRQLINFIEGSFTKKKL